jgi:hypothetical protein
MANSHDEELSMQERVEAMSLSELKQRLSDLDAKRDTSGLSDAEEEEVEEIENHIAELEEDDVDDGDDDDLEGDPEVADKDV